ncbi:MAG TPA: hypothetical protein VK581_11205 [Chthoniobacterales bacterium]|nr:hypothetical protein [Chthoniobacterales bacterium]
MGDVIADYVLLAWVLMSVSTIGIALCHRFTRLTGIELVGYGLAAGVASHGIFGLLIAVSWRLRPVFILLPVGCAVASIFYLSRRRVWQQLFPALTRPVRISLLIWLLFLAFCVALIHLNVRFPASLPDGMYVFKKQTLNVKIQVMTALPADNYIPYVVTEYFLRHISFRQVRPILPANEVSNRTILMSLVALPFRAALSWPHYGSNQMGRFDYLGMTWPDWGKLYEEASFRQFLVVGIFLNSLLLVGLIVLFSNSQSTNGLPFAALLFATNAYAINQTIFTWPKAMAGFFIVLCWDAIRRNFDPPMVGLCAAVAYHCHPSSVAVAASLGLWYAIHSWRAKESRFRPAFQFTIAFVLGLLPWLIWTKVILRIPSDMIAQNFAGPGTQQALASSVDFIWIRFRNLFDTFAPLPFSVYPFQLEAVVNYATFCVPFAVGIFLIVPAFLECWRLRRKERMLVCFGLVIPAAAILALYSGPALPMLHGWQPIIGALIFLGLLRLRRTLAPSTFAVLITLQLLCNLWIVAARGILIGAHFS